MTSAAGPAAPALARCVGDSEGFLAEHFAASPHRWAGSPYDDLLSLADVDGQLSGAGLRRPALRMVRDGAVLDPSTWTRRARTGSVWVDDLVHPGRTLGLFADGATIVLQSLHRWWPPLTRFCRELESALGHAVQANAYLTPPGAAGLTPHHDTHDVFVLQVHGTKHWTIREPLVDAPLARHRSDHVVAARQPVLFEAQMAPGDCLYLPRGFIHSAAAQDGVSLHITIGVLATTVHDLLRRLLDRAADEPAFRRTLPPTHASDADAARAVVKEAVAELSGWLAHLDVEPVAAQLVESAALRRAPLLDGQLLELAALGSVDDDTVVERRAGVVTRTAIEDGRLTLRLGDRRLDLPAEVAPAVDRLLDGAPSRVRDLGDLLDEGSRAVLVRRLIREGALRTTHGA
jgi:hypothetical protein